MKRPRRRIGGRFVAWVRGAFIRPGKKARNDEEKLIQANSFGKIAVPTPGTPVRVSTNTDLRAACMRFAVVIGETGRVFLGVGGMNKANGTGVLKEFWPTGAGGGVADAFEIWAVDERHLLAPADYYVDANNAGEGLIVAYWGR